MQKNNHRLSGIASIALASMLAVPGAASAQEVGGSLGHERIKEHIDANYNRRMESMNPERYQNNAALMPFNVCQVVVTVDYVYPIGDPHLDINDMLLMVGPLPISGNFQITPLSAGNPWNHPWKSGHYVAEPDPVYPGWYDIWKVGVKPHNTEVERDHRYRMYISDVDEEDCPEYVFFHSAEHLGGTSSSDPGHAGARR